MQSSCITQFEMMANPMLHIKKCTACAGPVSREIIHPLLFVPVCMDCDYHYNSGEFTIENGNEIYCRLCGEGEGALLLCDTCPKSFCTRCITNTVGISELRRIQKLSDRWHCFVCSPQPIQDLCIKNGWKYHTLNQAAKKQSRKGVVFADISRGREKFEIPVINEVDKEGPPLDFVYVAAPVAGEGVVLSSNPEHLGCCSCTDNCRDPTKCECALQMGGSFAYDTTGVIMNEKPGGIYECNSRCACNANRCKNRVVGSGPHLRLEVFRCDNPLKGWGVRCKNDIYPGTYVADYLGEILLEEDSEKRGLMLNDEYLFTQDFWGRSCALDKLADLGIKQHLHSIPREEDKDITVMDKAEVSKYLDPELVELLSRKGAIDRALDMGRKLREDPVGFIAQLDEEFKNENEACSAIRAQQQGKAAPIRSSTSGSKNAFKLRMGKAAGGGKGGRMGSINAVLDLDADDIHHYDSDDSSARPPTAGNKKAAVGKDRKKRPLHGGKDAAASAAATATADTSAGLEHRYRSWHDFHLAARQKALEQGISVISDRTIIEVEQSTQTYTIDGRYAPPSTYFFCTIVFFPRRMHSVWIFIII